MKKRDKKETILRELRDNSRQSLAKISKRHGLPETTVFLLHKELEKEVIKRNVSIINFKNLGYPIRNVVLLESLEGIESLSHRINNIYKTKEGYMVELLFKDTKEKYDFIENKKPLKVYDIIEDLKREYSVSQTQSLNI